MPRSSFLLSIGSACDSYSTPRFRSVNSSTAKYCKKPKDARGRRGRKGKIRARKGVGSVAERLEELLGTEEVAEYLGVGQVTVYRWCREGSLPCIKIGRRWRIRRDALAEFVRKSERSETLTGRLRAFLEVPDNVMAIAQDRELMHRMDAAFFRVGEARGGTLVKYHREAEGMPTAEELRDEFVRNGLEVGRLEGEGRLRFVSERGEPGERIREVERMVAQEGGEGRSVWVDFNWESGLELEAA